MLPKARTDNLVVTDREGELLVYDPASRTVHSLSPVTAFVWTRADGRTDVATLADLLSEQMRVTGAEEVVLFALKRLEYAGLLEAPAELSPALTRRQVV